MALRVTSGAGRCANTFTLRPQLFAAGRRSRPPRLRAAARTSDRADSSLRQEYSAELWRSKYAKPGSDRPKPRPGRWEFLVATGLGAAGCAAWRPASLRR